MIKLKWIYENIIYYNNNNNNIKSFKHFSIKNVSELLIIFTK